MYYEDRARAAQTAANMGRMREVYKITEELAGKKRKRIREHLKNAEGVVMEERKLAEMWTEHFRKTLNAQEPQEILELDASLEKERLPIDEGQPSRQEILEVLKELKNNNAPGIDEIPAECLSVSKEYSTDSWLVPLFRRIWNQEKIPEDWRKGVIAKIPKTGDLTCPDNWREITLLSTTSKVFLKILQGRISRAVDELIDDEQAGFGHGRNTTDNIFTVRNILES